MALLKEGAITEDPWTSVADDEPVPGDTRAIVSLERWQAEREELIGRNCPLGIRLRSDQSPALIAEDLGRFDVIALEFPLFKDGRAYSYARLLRERFGYEGAIRAVGDVLRDQFFFMVRCGFTEFEVPDGVSTTDWQDAMAELSVVYQATQDGRPTALDARHGDNA